MLCSMIVPCHISPVSTVPQLTWMRIRMLPKNILFMYVIHVAKSGLIMARRCRAILLRHFGCSWLAVACCLVSASLLRCRLPQHRSMHVATKQPPVNRALALSRTQDIFYILCNQYCFLLRLALQVPPMGVTWLILTKNWCHAMGVCLTLFHALYGCMAM